MAIRRALAARQSGIRLRISRGDISPTAISVAQERAHRCQENCEFFPFDVLHDGWPGDFEPFAGEGRVSALVSARELVPWLDRVIDEKIWSREIERGRTTTYHHRNGHRQQFCRRFTWLMRSPKLVSLLLNLSSVWPWLPQQVVNRINSSITLSTMAERFSEEQ